ncbi:MAG: polysaccharide pyruvyl transferase family protein [Bdellovibrionota bacterium]
MTQSITLLGSSSGRNAGDAALIHAIMDACDQAAKQKFSYEIPTINPKFVKNSYPHNVVPISIMPWNLAIKIFGLPTYQSIMRTDISLIFDAVLFDRSLFNPLFNFLSTFHCFLLAAKRKGKKFGLFNVGLGPVTTLLGERMLREVVNAADFVTVRDQGSFDVLKQIGAENPNCLITADAALNCPQASEDDIEKIIQELGFEKDQEILAVNVNQYLDTWASAEPGKLTRQEFIEVISTAINNCLTELNVGLLLVSTQHHDLSLTQEIAAKINSPQKIAILDNRRYNHLEIKGVLSKVQLLFGMRLHAMILGSSAFTPIVGLAYQPKCKFYFDLLGLESHLYHFDNFDKKKIFNAIMSGWQDRVQIRKTLENKVPELQQRALLAGEITTQLLQGMPTEQVFKSLSLAS